MPLRLILLLVLPLLVLSGQRWLPVEVVGARKGVCVRRLLLQRRLGAGEGRHVLGCAGSAGVVLGGRTECWISLLKGIEAAGMERAAAGSLQTAAVA